MTKRARQERADTTPEPDGIPGTETRSAPLASAEVPAASGDEVEASGGRAGREPDRATPPGTPRPRPERASVAATQAGDSLPDVDDPLGTSPQAAIGEPQVVRNHRRFALSEVTFDGDSVGGATIDTWQNATGAACWSARVLMPLADGQTAGALTGRTRDGRFVRGRVSLGGSGAGPRTRGAVLVEWHGVSSLRVVDAAAEDDQ